MNRVHMRHSQVVNLFDTWLQAGAGGVRLDLPRDLTYGPASMRAGWAASSSSTSIIPRGSASMLPRGRTSTADSSSAASERVSLVDVEPGISAKSFVSLAAQLWREVRIARILLRFLACDLNQRRLRHAD